MNDMQRRAAARRERLVITMRRLGEDDVEAGVTGEDAISLVSQLSMTAWAWSGEALPQLHRHELPVRFIAGRRT